MVIQAMLYWIIIVKLELALERYKGKAEDILGTGTARTKSNK